MSRMIELLAKGRTLSGPPAKSCGRNGVGSAARLAMRSSAFRLVVVAIVFAVSVTVGVVAAVMGVGVGAASGGLYLLATAPIGKANAARGDRGEIRVVAGPAISRPASRAALDETVLDRLTALGYGAADLGQVIRFDGGWIVGLPWRSGWSWPWWSATTGGLPASSRPYVDDLQAASGVPGRTGSGAGHLLTAASWAGAQSDVRPR